jgi:hypothetical protein
MAQQSAAESGFELRTLALRGDDRAAWAALADVHAYQISSAQDEVPAQWCATV